MPTTPYMSLYLPTVSTTLGPDWASNLNDAFTLVDAHNHASGTGQPVPVRGLYIDADLPLNGFNATNLRSLRMVDQGSALAQPTDVGCVYVAGGNLYYNNGAGVAVQITAGSALNASSLGAIGGDYATSGASEFYTSASKTFSFEQSSGVKANLDASQVTIRQAVAAANGVTLKSPSSLASAYSLTLLTGLPASTKPLAVDSTGQIIAADSLTLNGDLALAKSGDQQVIKSGGGLFVGTSDGSMLALKTNGVTAAIVDTSQNLNMQNHLIYALATPTASDQAATKGYVDGRAVYGVVNYDGSIAYRSDATVTVSRTGEGAYKITYAGLVATSAVIVTPRASSDYFGNYSVYVQFQGGGSHSYYIYTYQIGVGASDTSFSFVLCP